jgi:small-conductance mechanosensitive channel
MEFWGLDTAQWNQVAISMAIVAVSLLLGRWLVRRLLFPFLRQLTGSTQGTLNDLILDKVEGPAYWLLMVAAFKYALRRLDFINRVGTLPLNDIFFILYLAIAFLLTWRLVSSLFNWYIETQSARTDTRLDLQLLPFFSRVALIVIVLIAGIILLGHFNVEVSGLVATLGIGSLAIALAAQEALSDTISGFLIMIDRPFRIGDRIEIQELGTWGDVIDIGLRSSRVRTLDNRMVIVPNSVIGKGLIVNYSYPDSTYRLETEISVAYWTDIEKARGVLIKAVKDLEGVDPNHAVEALLVTLGDSAMIFRVRWWLDSYVDTRRMFDRVHTSVVNALSTAGIEIPFPQMDVRARLNPDQQAALDRHSKQQ